jgi:hypothetical protein
MLAPTPFVRRRRAASRATCLAAALASLAATQFLLAPSEDSGETVRTVLVAGPGVELRAVR